MLLILIDIMIAGQDMPNIDLELRGKVGLKTSILELI